MKRLILFSALLLGTQAFAGQLEWIRQQYENQENAQTFNALDLIGGYEGQCFEGEKYQFEQKEALYLGIFKNVSGTRFILPMTTEHFYNNPTQPAFVVKYLNTDSKRNWTRLGQFTRLGWSGTDNNVGSVTTGEDFSYLYTAEGTTKSMTLKVGRQSFCQPGEFCSPPLAVACRSGHTANGFVFENCVLSDDTTTFKKISANQLVSKRTAKGWDLGPNLLTPDVGAASYCVWTLKTEKSKVPVQFRQ